MALAKIVQPGKLKAVIRIPETQAKDVAIAIALTLGKVIAFIEKPSDGGTNVVKLLIKPLDKWPMTSEFCNLFGERQRQRVRRDFTDAVIGRVRDPHPVARTGVGIDGVESRAEPAHDA